MGTSSLYSQFQTKANSICAVTTCDPCSFRGRGAPPSWRREPLERVLTAGSISRSWSSLQSKCRYPVGTTRCSQRNANGRCVLVNCDPGSRMSAVTQIALSSANHWAPSARNPRSKMNTDIQLVFTSRLSSSLPNACQQLKCCSHL